MEIEDVFDIQLEDAEAEKMRTPGDLIESVLSKVSRADVTVCLTQRAFNLLRKALLRALPLKRRQIAPAVPLGDLVAKNARDHLIAQLATELNTGPLPVLVRPRWLEHPLFYFPRFPAGCRQWSNSSDHFCFLYSNPKG